MNSTKSLYLNMNLIDKYGYYRIKKGTILFRKAINTNIYNEMFFGFSVYSTSSSSVKTDEIQIWEIKKDINVFFMIKDYSINHKKISSIVDIYNFLYPDNKLNSNDDIYIKQNINVRTELINELKKLDIKSWVSSVENKDEMELFLFSSIDLHSEMIQFIKSIKINNKVFDNYYKIESFKIENILKKQ